MRSTANTIIICLTVIALAAIVSLAVVGAPVDLIVTVAGGAFSTLIIVAVVMVMFS